MYFPSHVLQNLKVLTAHGVFLQAHSSTWNVIYHVISPTGKLTQIKDGKRLAKIIFKQVYEDVVCIECTTYM